MKQLQIVVAGSLAAIGGILGQIAETPPQLQAQIPQMFPEKIRGYVAMVCQTVAGIAFIYALLVAHKPVTPPTKTEPDSNTDTGAPKLPIAILAALLIPMGIIGCESVADFLESPTNAKVLQIASSAGAASLLQSTGIKATPDQQAILQSAASTAINTASTGAVWWFAEWLRTKQSTPQAAKAGAIASGGVPLPVATAVPALVASGVTPDAANEAVAMTVQTVAASK